MGKAYLADFHATNQSTVNLKTGSNVITLYGKYAEITYKKKANGRYNNKWRMSCASMDNSYKVAQCLL